MSLSPSIDDPVSVAVDDEIEVFEAPAECGVYDDIPNEVYHGDRADRLCLSSSMVRRFLKTSPAQWYWERQHPRLTSTKYFDLGTLVHTLTLGTGPGFVVIDADSFRTDKAKEERDAAWKNHQTPVLPAQYELAEDMRDALLRDEIVGTLLSDSHNERSLYARDPVSGLMLRSRPDSMNDTTGRLILGDIKTTEDADPSEFSWSAYKFGYAEQADFYRWLAILLGMDRDPAFLFFVVSTLPPHLVSVIELKASALAYGQRRNRRAIDRIAACHASDTWPDHSGEIHLVDLPRRAYTAEEYTR